MYTRRRGRIGTGKIYDKILQLLEAAGFDVQFTDIWVQKGAYRHATWDLARWGGDGMRKGIRTSFASWDTMTDCARYGIVLTKDDVNSYEISKKEK